MPSKQVTVPSTFDFCCWKYIPVFFVLFQAFNTWEALACSCQYHRGIYSFKAFRIVFKKTCLAVKLNGLWTCNYFVAYKIVLFVLFVLCSTFHYHIGLVYRYKQSKLNLFQPLKRKQYMLLSTDNEEANMKIIISAKLFLINVLHMFCKLYSGK